VLQKKTLKRGRTQETSQEKKRRVSTACGEKETEVATRKSVHVTKKKQGAPKKDRKNPQQASENDMNDE